MLRLIVALLCLGFSNASNAWPRIDPVPGGVAAVELPASPVAPEVFYQNHPVWVRPRADVWVALVGIPLDTPPGEQQLTRTDAPPLSFEVSAKNYPEQRVTVQNQRHVDPTETDLRRIKVEHEQTTLALARFSPAHAVKLPWQLPAQGRLSSPFGLRRYFNGAARKPHAGLDVAAPRGAPIHAPAPGVVVLVGEFFFNGNCILLDHGQGLITAYMHLDQVEVVPEQIVQTGDRLGTVGSTGRATGPHLHWGVYLNQTAVNPELFVTGIP